MTNPLAKPMQGNDLRVGETRVVQSRTGGEPFRITRTERPYEFDLADAYNDRLPHHLREQGVRWVVASNGGLMLAKSNEDLKRQVKAERAAVEHRDTSRRAA